ncbi:MAG: Signal recognition particle 19 kDa protein [Candidatus Methanofastidiosum methylothiophilum]|uniref:Signal recognition particle 19 kDa protein n=1 Tax=Candidatus Methanofastidiosum methylothiophilum TaxID=1705564 RepID=A0A150J029_9EURY|nr:MAG: Signal recognition particle 19 kDa protein [Candidatus Methanofastidiosum methylthiophilus]KYC47948.1 MAG: Signal recognition particle 19 kDa protein [Candidatus Methanofastidiosum methylthiophilus]KYC50566.1 MAG: Signal recognition particle 19 kDa protein [Candidatus Methanofastidiosum methylthiophilus]
MKGYVVWPSYLDKNLSKKGGRKLPKNLALDAPKFDEIKKALESIGITHQVEKTSKYPKDQGREDRKLGRFIVEKKFSKNEILKKISKEIRKNRGGN